MQPSSFVLQRPNKFFLNNTFSTATATRTVSHHPCTVQRHCVTGQRNMATLSEVVSTLKKMAPLTLAESWDNVGLLVEPDVRKPVSLVFLTNDLTEDVLEEAVSVDADLIISYHPPVFTPFKRITSDSWKVPIIYIYINIDMCFNNFPVLYEHYK